MIMWLLSSMAFAHESSPQDLTIFDQLEFFNQLEVDSGWIPSSGLLGIRLQQVADGGAEVRMEGEGQLRWPDDLQFTAFPYEESGYIALNSNLSSIVSIRFDVAGYQWEAPISESTTAFFSEKTFDPYLLAESLDIEASSTEEQLIEYDYDVLPGVSVGFSAELRPKSKLTFTGQHWEIDEQIVASSEDQATWTPDGSEALEVEAVYSADVASELEIDFIPVFEVCVPLFGCFDWDVAEFPLTVLENDSIHSFPPINLRFPLPVAVASTEQIDFGEIPVDDLANWELTVDNLGELYLDAELQVVGDSEVFPLFPNSIYAIPFSQDGVIVSFAPTQAGDFSATLQIISNDPFVPLIEIPIMGTAFQEEVPELDTAPEDTGVELSTTEPQEQEANVDKTTEVVDGCGCASAQHTTYPIWLVLAVVCYRRRVREW